MADVGDILNNNEFFGDVADTPKEGMFKGCHKQGQGTFIREMDT